MMSRMVPNTFSVGLSSESYVFRASRLRLAPQLVKRIIYAARRFLWGKFPEVHCKSSVTAEI
jgi:hypothetical protein